MKKKDLTTKEHKVLHKESQSKYFVFLSDGLRELCGKKEYEINR